MRKWRFRQVRPNVNIHGEREREKERKTDRQINRETERQRDRETERQRGRVVERQRDRETERQRDRERLREIDRDKSEIEKKASVNKIITLSICCPEFQLMPKVFHCCLQQL
jgi:hypothetical protein